MTIKFDVKGNDYFFAESPIKEPSDTVGIISCEFTFDKEWDGLTIQANWMNYSIRKSITTNIEDGKCVVPPEVMTREGTVCMSLEGIATGKKMMSFRKDVLDIDKVIPPGTASQNPTPSQYEQYVAAVKGYHDQVVIMKDQVEESATSAQTSATNSATSAQSASGYANSASGSASAAATSANLASGSATSASNSASAASGSATAASGSATSAETAKNQAVTAKDQAVSAKNSAEAAEAKIESMTVSAQGGQSANVEKQEYSDHYNLKFTLPKGDTGEKGDTGATGNGIASTVLNADYTLTITFTDGTSYTSPSIRGAQGETGLTGNGIASTVLNEDYTLTITFTNGTTYTTPSIRGQQGQQGETGATGATGATGNGIASIAKTATVGKLDTYTVTYTNGDTFTYNVKNGEDGQGSGDMLTSVYDPEGGVRQVAFKDTVTAHTTDTTIHTTTAEKSEWSAKYDKPASGIPSSDMTSAVQTSLGKADTALQTHQDISGKADVSTVTAHTSNTTIHTSTAEKSGWSAKYDKPSGGIPSSDMASAVQTSLGLADSSYQKPASGIPKTDLASSVQTSLGKADTAIQDISGKADTTTVSAIDTRVTTIEGKIPNQATSSNQLGDKDFINSSINSVTAFYITKNAGGDQFNTHAELLSATTFYSGGEVRVPTRNDYCIVLVDEDKENATTRYIYQNSQWEYQYTVNETALTAAQLAAINSGITSGLVATFNAKQDALVSGTNIKTLNNTSLLGSGNIDINSAVWGSISGTMSNQTDLQSELDDKEDEANKVTSLSSSSTDTQYPSAKCLYDNLQVARIPIGTIVPFGGSVVPSGWLECNGIAVNRTVYAQLFAVIGTTYGAGDGSTTFNLPDLQGKVVAGVSGTDGDFDLGDVGGEKTHTLTESEMPSHRHSINQYNQKIYPSGSANNGIYPTPASNQNTNYTGGGQAHNNLQPYLTTKYIIKANNNSISEPVSPTIEQRIGAIETEMASSLSNVPHRTLLWTNPNPSSSFSGQTISLDLSNYTQVGISFSLNGSYYDYLDYIVIDKGKKTAFSKIQYNNNAIKNYQRNITQSGNSGITFVDCLANNTSDNSYLIPQYIYGIKYGR